MKIKKIAGRLMPNFKKSYLKVKQFQRYRERRNTDPKDYPELMMRDWTRRGNEPFDINHPQTYRQKILWSELYEKDERKTLYSDKITVRDWVKEKLGEEFLIPCLGVFDDPYDINFDELPERFVIKVNTGSGFNIIVKDKATLNRKKTCRQLKKWMKIDYAFFNAFQPHYIGIKPRILIEQYLSDKNGELRDYKFLCFNDIVKYCWVDIGRYGSCHCRNVYDLDWNLQPWRQSKPNYDGPVEKPENFEEMVRIADILCKGFSHVRVDLYNVDGKIYFGEMTFSNGGGQDKILPPEYDKILGDEWVINQKNI